MEPSDQSRTAGASAEHVTTDGDSRRAETLAAEDVNARLDARLDALFELDHVSPADLRAVSEHLRSYVDRLQSRLQNEVSESVYHRCIEAIEELRGETKADIEGAVRRIRAFVQATSTRVNILEKDRRPRARPSPAQADALRAIVAEFETLDARLRTLDEESPPVRRKSTGGNHEGSEGNRSPRSACTDCRAHRGGGAESPPTTPRSPYRRGDDSPSPRIDRPVGRRIDFEDNHRSPRGEGQRHHDYDERRSEIRRNYEDPVELHAREHEGIYDRYRPPGPPLDTSDRANRAPYVAPDRYDTDRELLGYRPRFEKSPRKPPFERRHYPRNPLLPAGSYGYPVGQSLAGGGSPWGPPHPGLPDNTTLLEPFQAVISYRAYRLNDTRPGPVPVERLSKVGKLAAAVKGLVRETLSFDGREPIRLLGFLTDIKRGFDGTGISEGLGVHVVQYFVEGDAARFYRTVTSTALRSFHAPAEVEWPVLVHQFLRRYVPDSVLGDAYNRVTRMVQREDEDELRYADRIQDAAMDCPGVFTEPMLINYYVRGLPKTTQDTVAEQVSRLPLENRGDFFAVRKIAHAEGATYRARLRMLTAPPEGTTKTTPAKPTKPVMLMGRGIPEVIEGPSPPLSIASSPLRPEEFEILYRRGPLDSSNEAPYPILITQDDNRRLDETTEVTDEIDVTRRVERAIPQPIPRMTDYDLRCAESMIPENDSWYVCWACRDVGHALYRCPYLSRRQQLYFAMCNYRYQREAYPSSRNLLDQKVRDGGRGGTRRGAYRGEDRRGNEYRGNRNDRGTYGGRGRDRQYYGEGGQPKEILRREPGTRPSKGQPREETDADRRDRFAAAVMTLRELSHHPAVADYTRENEDHRGAAATGGHYALDSDSSSSDSLPSKKG